MSLDPVFCPVVFALASLLRATKLILTSLMLPVQGVHRYGCTLALETSRVALSNRQGARNGIKLALKQGAPVAPTPRTKLAAVNAPDRLYGAVAALFPVSCSCTPGVSPQMPFALLSSI